MGHGEYVCCRFNAWDGKKNIINYEYTTTIMVNLFV